MARQVDAAERTVRALFDAFAARDAEASALLLHPDVEFWAQPTGELARRDGPYRGHDGYREYLADVDRVWSAIDVEPQDFRVAGTGVIAFGRLRGIVRDTGEPADESLIWVFRLRDGLVVYGRVGR